MAAIITIHQIIFSTTTRKEEEEELGQSIGLTASRHKRDGGKTSNQLMKSSRPFEAWIPAVETVPYLQYRKKQSHHGYIQTSTGRGGAAAVLYPTCPALNRDTFQVLFFVSYKWV